MSNLKLKAVLSFVDRASKPMRRVAGVAQRLSRQTGVGRVARAAVGAGKALDAAAGQAGRFGVKVAAIGGGVGFLFKKGLLDTAAAFEKFLTILETTEGSSDKAKAAFKWVNDFAATTPFQLAEVTGAFVKLRAFGLNPMGGLLRTLGDTAAAMGKSVDQAVEAIADAATGEFERLKEFGIKARTVGKRIVFEYSQNGKTLRKIVGKGNRQQIQSTLQAIWNEKYGGAMDKLLKTWGGMMSLISDQWTRFANMIMEAGVFDFLKDKLGGFLKQIDAMAASGELQALAVEIGGKLTAAFKRLWEIGGALSDVIVALAGMALWAKTVMGGWEPVIATVAAVIAGPLLAALVSVAGAFATLGLALMATPVGWFLAAAAAIAGAAGLIYENWDSVAAALQAVWTSLKVAGLRLKEMFVGVAATIVQSLARLTQALPKTIQTTLGLDGIGRAAKALDELRRQANLDINALQLATPAARDRTRRDKDTFGSGRQEVGGQVTVRFENAPAGMRVTELKSSTPDFSLDVDAGGAFAGVP